MEHSAALSGAVAAMRQDSEQRLTKAVEDMRQEEQVCVSIGENHACMLFMILTCKMQQRTMVLNVFST